ncbi:MAG: pyridoxamine 5'-phosphate oxidase family protein [Acidobacteria bacterium]|nr:pyridoxamine 5'-phosphate oxidase family protein [Acidobacteriota bacterium]
MTDDEMWAFIEEQKSLQVATLDRDGSVHLSTLWFAIVDESIVFETYTRSQKIKNLERDSRITLLWEDGTEYEKLRGAMVKTTAELVTDTSEVHSLALEVMVRNTPGVDRETLSQAAEHMAVKRTAVVSKLASAVTWDHTKLGGGY